jgi:molybdopterin-containing oxidoreductase family iron-sulfur binding subunit
MSEQVKTPGYWKSLNELAQNEAYKAHSEKEFAEGAEELKDGFSRRNFLQIMGASVALAGFAACRRPVQKIVPYVRQPEDKVAGIPIEYATSMPFQDVLHGVIVENYEGRPTKLQGNKDQTSSLGGSSLFGQASVLGLYDPDRSRFIRKNGEKASRADFEKFAAEHFSDKNRSIVFISEANSSISLNEAKKAALSTFKNAQWLTYEAFGDENVLEGNNLAFGKRLRTVKDFKKADVVLSLGDDFLNTAENKNAIADTRDFVSRRKVTSSADSLNRLYMIENSFSITGSSADHRLRVKASDIPAFTVTLAAELGLSGATKSDKFANSAWLKAVAKDLKANQGKSLVTAAYNQAPWVHALVARINDSLKNNSTTVSYLSLPHLGNESQSAALKSAIDGMKAGQVDTLVLVGTNPVLTMPKDLGFSDAMAKVGTVIHLSDYVDETSKNVTWHVNRAHYLESWGDGFSFDGVAAVIQPQIQPLHGGLTEIEFIHTIVEGKKVKGYDIVRANWSDFASSWDEILHNGASTWKLSTENVSYKGTTDYLFLTSNDEDIELVIKADNKIFDGRYANNGWLQELPEPMTKITWDNVALMSANTAQKLGVKGMYSYEDIKLKGPGRDETDLITIKNGDKELTVAAWILPGHVDNSITLSAGYGRSGIGRVANALSDASDVVGFDAYKLRAADSDISLKVTATLTGANYEIASTQDHASMEGRALVREASISEYKENAKFASFEDAFGFAVPGLKEAAELNEDKPVSLFNEQVWPDYEPQWGMSIDLNSCIGCGICVVACQSENNIPVIGKREVRRGREMSWLRIDRYFKGDSDNPGAVHLPIACQHCELAPCEQVCPVAATTHSDDGLNQMTYNRCIGTRYCANNCPYKVRRFNFFNYAKTYLTEGDDPELIQMAMNPDVTVRFRGVMEKCTYCVQKINRAKIETKNETGNSVKPLDGTVHTACQSACPANAITFGDISDTNSMVSKAKQNERSYALLEELNVRPRTSYVAKVSNPNPELV